MKRDDINVMCSWVVTLPKDFPSERAREFFECAYRFFVDRYGGKDGENIIGAYVHMDEKRPHMHFQHLPVV